MMNTPLKLNLGCGPIGRPDWINYDWGALPLLSKMPRLRRFLVRRGWLPVQYEVPWPTIRLVDIRKGLPLADESVTFIYCSHVLEHLERWEARRVLSEARRVLLPGGVIRIAVPDLAHICRAYLDSSAKREAHPARDASRLLWGHPKDVEPVGWIGRWSRKFIRGHEWAYDEEEMRDLMREAGLSEIQRCSFRKGKVPDLETLELESHAPHSLYMEAAR